MTGIQRWWHTRNARVATRNYRDLQQAAHWAQLETVRTMPFDGRNSEDLLTTGMRMAARQSVQDSAALQSAIAALHVHVLLPEHLDEPVDAALKAVGRLARLRESWMRHRPAVEEMFGLSGANLLQRIERGQVRGVEAPGPWQEDEEAQAAMQLALPPLECLYRATSRVTGQLLFPQPPVGVL